MGQEHEEAPLVELICGYGRSVHSVRIVPAYELDHGKNRLPRSFRENIGQNESFP